MTSRTPEDVIIAALRESGRNYAQQADRIMRELKLAGFEVIDMLGDVTREVADLLAEQGETGYDCTDPANPAWGDCAYGVTEEQEENECGDQDCRAQGCPEHPAHNGPDHTYEQHHSSRDHVGAGPCRCTG